MKRTQTQDERGAWTRWSHCCAIPIPSRGFFLLAGLLAAVFCFPVGGAGADMSAALPVLLIDAGGRAIPQQPAMPAHLTVLPGTDPGERLAGVIPYTQVDYRGHASLHIRGNSSQAHDKKPYKLELQDTAGRDLKAPLLGMPAESDWVLNSCYTDKTLVRDALAMELWREMGHYAPRTRFVEVFLTGVPPPAAAASAGRTGGGGDSNALVRTEVAAPGDGRTPTNATAPRAGAASAATWTQSPEIVDLARKVGAAPRDYTGIYLLMEKIKRGRDRVDIVKSKPGSAGDSNAWIRGGYIFKKDRLNIGEKGFMSSLGLLFSMEDPKERDAVPAQINWLRGHVRGVESVLFGESFKDPDTGYSAYVDVDSFIDYHWLTEIGKNIDGYWFSQFYHLDRGGKLKLGPVWDWDLSFGNAFYHEGHRPTGWRWSLIRGNSYKWYARMFEDPEFLQRYMDRWHELRLGIFATSNILARVDALVAQVQEAQVRNYQRWPTLGAYVHPNRFIGKSYEEGVEWMKDWIARRLAWIDTQDFPPAKAWIVSAPEAGIGAIATESLSAQAKGASSAAGDGPANAGGSYGISLQAGTGRIFYTLDGMDPRQKGGWPSGTAREYSATVNLGTNDILYARVRSDDQIWSAPTIVWWDEARKTICQRNWQ